uniref:Uncharacterized protein n=1 Tax=Anopheles darlingi TaxID=43151 RepID=A0A2M4DD23_ANODA
MTLAAGIAFVLQTSSARPPVLTRTLFGEMLICFLMGSLSLSASAFIKRVIVTSVNRNRSPSPFFLQCAKCPNETTGRFRFCTSSLICKSR